MKRNLKTLRHLRKNPVIRANSGSPGTGRQKHGKDGKDIEIQVPPGTIVKSKDTEEIIRDFTEVGTQWVFLRGGRGGKGNVHYKSSRLQAPRYAQPGQPGIHALIKVELNIMADIGFVGFPNAGKSSLLGVLTNAHPKVAEYPFTTKIPHLGVMNFRENDIILADIPGIIEGASHGAGMGLKFLKHISRTKGLAFLLDLTEPNAEQSFYALLSELREFSPELAEKKRIIVGTKLDLPETEEALAHLRTQLPEEKVAGISAFTNRGLEDLKKEFFNLSLEE